MSYILEALKKSQQERELGRVPTLDVMPVVAEGPDTRPSYWGVAAVGLAALAVIIALFTALRGMPSVPESESTAPLVESSELAGPPPAAVTPEPQQAPPTPSTSAQTKTAAEDTTATSSAKSPTATTVPAEPEVERARESSEDRRYEALGEPKAPSTFAEPQPAKRDKVPEDLRQDIEAFKDNVRNKRTKDQKAEAPAAEIPPQELELPRDVAVRLPTLIMTVHIYDDNPAKRFVLINGRKTREGKSTREGVAVEEILPDGAVLNYDGHRFFRHR